MKLVIRTSFLQFTSLFCAALFAQLSFALPSLIASGTVVSGTRPPATLDFKLSLTDVFPTSPFVELSDTGAKNPMSPASTLVPSWFNGKTSEGITLNNSALPVDIANFVTGAGTFTPDAAIEIFERIFLPVSPGSGVAYRAMGNGDPWVAVGYEYENQTSENVEFFSSLAMPIQDTGGIVFYEGALDITVIDSNSSGDASFINGDFRPRADMFSFNGGNILSASIPLPGAGAFADVTSAEGKQTVVQSSGNFDLSAALVADGGGTEAEDFFLTISGILSPGDTVILEGFYCFANDAASCPSRPAFSVAPIPIPAPFLLLGSGLVAIRWFRSKAG